MVMCPSLDQIRGNLDKQMCLILDKEDLSIRNCHTDIMRFEYLVHHFPISLISLAISDDPLGANGAQSRIPKKTVHSKTLKIDAENLDFHLKFGGCSDHR